MSTEPLAEPARGGAPWYRQPVAWLAALILVASFALVAVTIVVAERHADEPLPVAGVRVLKTPVARPLGSATPENREPAE